VGLDYFFYIRNDVQMPKYDKNKNKKKISHDKPVTTAIKAKLT
jgi:hypothetical protein